MSTFIIQKKQGIEDNYKNNLSFYNSARDGLNNILNLDICQNRIILLPAYIGYSTSEGSGIFDPIKQSNTPYVFYNLTSNLEIDFDKLKEQIDNNRNGILLFVHYFGFIDVNLKDLRSYAIDKGFIIIEDCAHALFTFHKDPDYTSDFILFSLHKMLPFRSGGLVISQKCFKTLANEYYYDLFSFDFKGISNRRQENYLYLEEKIKILKNSNIKLLHKALGNNIPQTLPVLISSMSLRDYLYFELNKRSIGVVSLYHQLIESVSLYSNENYLSNHILNLPVHQDINKNEIDYYFKVLVELLP